MSNPTQSAAAAGSGYTTELATMPTARKFLIFGAMAFGMFMAVLDIQVVAASLNDVQAGLSAGPDEISWVQTAYLMAELVMIPFSAYLAQAMSTRWLFAMSAALFTLSSVLCGFAWNIDSMILFRAIQGFTGGAMIPTVFATGYALFTGKQRALIPAILGMVAVLAPTLGPTVGGVITQAFDWRWIFFINVAPGIAVTVLAIALIRVDRPNPAMFKRIDWVHLTAMAVCLAALEYVLEEGPRLGWLGDPHIAIGAWVSFVAFLLFLERSLYSDRPIVALAPFRNPTFAAAAGFNLVIGFGLYAATYLIPIYLGRVRGYDSLQIGTTVFVVGAAQIVATMIAASLSERIDRRLMLAAGLSLFGASLWLTSDLTPEWGFAQLFLPQILRGLAIMLCIVPTVGMALSGFEGPTLRSASGLFNLMRNLGGAIGIALVNTWLQDNARIASLRLGESLGRDGRTATGAIEDLAHGFAATTSDPAHAEALARGWFGQLIGRQALTIAFDDVFRLMALIFLAALVLLPLTRPSTGAAASSAEAH